MVITVDMPSALAALAIVSIGFGIAASTLFVCLLTVLRDTPKGN